MYLHSSMFNRLTKLHLSGWVLSCLPTSITFLMRPKMFPEKKKGSSPPPLCFSFWGLAASTEWAAILLLLLYSTEVLCRYVVMQKWFYLLKEGRKKGLFHIKRKLPMHNFYNNGQSFFMRGILAHTTAPRPS